MDAARSPDDLASHIEIEVGESGPDETSYAKCEDIKSVSDRRLLNRLGTTGDEVLFAIATAVWVALWGSTPINTIEHLLVNQLGHHDGHS